MVEAIQITNNVPVQSETVKAVPEAVQIAPVQQEESKEPVPEAVKSEEIKAEEVKSEEIKAEEVKSEEIKEPVPKKHIILGIDPAFKNCGFGMISTENMNYVDSYVEWLRPEGKMTQSSVDGWISKRTNELINAVFEKYIVDYVVIELQLGQFSADRIQLAFVQALPDDCKFVVQHSKLKLNQPERKGMEADNKESGKYHQNKHLGRDLIKVIIKDVPEKITFDEADALLHAIYAYRNLKKIQFIQKSVLKQAE